MVCLCEVEGKIWLFALSQKYIDDLAKAAGKDCQTVALHNSFGFAPLAMPWIETNEHWKELRKALQGCFNKKMIEVYAAHFKKCTLDFVNQLAEKDGTVVSLREEI